MTQSINWSSGFRIISEKKTDEEKEEGDTFSLVGISIEI